MSEITKKVSPKLKLVPQPMDAPHSALPIPSKKERIIALFRDGNLDILQLSQLVGARPSYVAQVLQSEGLLSGYQDLYTPVGSEPNVYAQAFRNVISFRSVEAARKSVQRIGELYAYFERVRDRAGQHQAMVVALTALNRARWCGKLAEAAVFHRWLCTVMATPPPAMAIAAEDSRAAS